MVHGIKNHTMEGQNVRHRSVGIAARIVSENLKQAKLMERHELR
jgi:hypothetical protein